MTNAKRDENSRSTIICASKNDGTTIVPIYATSHALKTQDGSGQADNGNNGGKAMLDENSVPVWTALSSTGDGTVIEIYGDPATNAVLIKSL